MDVLKLYFICTSTLGDNWDEVGARWVNGWNSAWIDWDNDGWADWCRITGNEVGLKYLTCSFTNGSTVSETTTSSAIDAGWAGTGTWEFINRTASYCRKVGDHAEFHRCLPAYGRGVGAEFPK